MKFVKPRKPRGIKQNGYKSYDLCECCYAPRCDPMANSPKFSHMIDRRRAAGVCVACGYNPCRCKSKLHSENHKIQTHNNQKTQKVR